MGGRRVAQPERSLLLRRVLPHLKHQHQRQKNQHQSRPFWSVDNDASTRPLYNPQEVEEGGGEAEEDEDDEEEGDTGAEQVYSQDSNPSSAGSVLSARTAAGDETAEAASPIGNLERLRVIQRALRATIKTSAVTAATSYM